jgi:Ni,Fe-hydrogenase I small subunit
MDFLKDAASLRNSYWFIRYSRSHADVRRHYRNASKEADRLVAVGYCSELVRLYRLHLADTRRQSREAKFIHALLSASLD